MFGLALQAGGLARRLSGRLGAKMVCDNLKASEVHFAPELYLPPGSPWKITRTVTSGLLRRALPRILTGITHTTARIATETFSEIAKNLPKYIPNRSRPRPKRPKPRKFFTYKPLVPEKKSSQED